MKQLKRTLGGHMGDFALLTGAALTSIGAGMIYDPAGLICAGVLLMVGAVAAGDDK